MRCFTVVMLALFLAGCMVIPPTPTEIPPTPTEIPPTPTNNLLQSTPTLLPAPTSQSIEDRFLEYTYSLSHDLKLLKDYMQLMEEDLDKGDDPMFWTSGPMVENIIMSLDALVPPTTEDMKEAGLIDPNMDRSLRDIHALILEDLWWCRQVGYIGMRIEEYSTEELKEARGHCEKALEEMEAANPWLFARYFGSYASEIESEN